MVLLSWVCWRSRTERKAGVAEEVVSRIKGESTCSVALVGRQERRGEERRGGVAVPGEDGETGKGQLAAKR